MTFIKQNTFVLLLTLSVFIGLSGFSLHKYYVGITEINHNKDNKTLEIAIKLFTDDFEQALMESGEQEKLFLGETNEKPQTDEAVVAYLDNNFEIEVNGKIADWTYMGKDASIEAVWSFLLVENVKKVKSIEVRNTCLLDILPKQTNMIHVFANGNKMSKNFNNSKVKHNFKFE